MSKVTSVKKLLILVVALILCATVVFAACNTDTFTPLKEKPSGQKAESNGGIAVKYGEWLYYVNGYTSDSSADNTYSDDVKTAPRIGSIVRIKIAELETLFELSEKDFDDDDEFDSATEAIADHVRKNAETVVPKIYISNNSTTRQFTGIHIFGDRIYITTPNDELTSGGNTRTSELVLMSYALDGSNQQRHFTFTESSAQIWLDEVDGKVVATYLMNSELHTLDVASKTDTVVTPKDADYFNTDIENVNNVSSVNWDKIGGNVFFINSYGDICKLTVGQTKYDVVVENGTFKDHNDHIEQGDTTFTIQNVNNGEVYFTKSDKEQPNTILYWTNAEGEVQVALNTFPTGAIGWKNGQVIYPFKDGNYYGIKLIKAATADDEEIILSKEYNKNSISISKIEGDKLYYSSESVYYTIDLAYVTSEQVAEDYKGDAYAKGITELGWSTSDFVDVGDVHYVISLASGSITVVKFDPEEKSNSDKSVALTLTAAK